MNISPSLVGRNDKEEPSHNSVERDVLFWTPGGWGLIVLSLWGKCVCVCVAGWYSVADLSPHKATNTGPLWCSACSVFYVNVPGSFIRTFIEHNAETERGDGALPSSLMDSKEVRSHLKLKESELSSNRSRVVLHVLIFTEEETLNMIRTIHKRIRGGSSVQCVQVCSCDHLYRLVQVSQRASYSHNSVLVMFRGFLQADLHYDSSENCLNSCSF